MHGQNHIKFHETTSRGSGQTKLIIAFAIFRMRLKPNIRNINIGPVFWHLKTWTSAWGRSTR